MRRRTITLTLTLMVLATSTLTIGLLTKDVSGSLVSPEVDAIPSEAVIGQEISIRARIRVGAG
ncbi:MAG: hypothetical protein V3T10_05725 [Candidatus Bathyarchaeia archaeon]